MRSAWERRLAMLLAALAGSAPGLAQAAEPGAWGPASFPPLRLGAHLLALVVVAGAVRLIAPDRRARLRPAVILAVLHLGALGAASLLAPWVSAGSGELLWWLAGLTRLLLTVNLITIVVFDVVLRVARVPAPAILEDVVVGVAFLAAMLFALKRGGLNLSGIIATSAVVSGVLGLALAPTIGNVLGGFALQLDDSLREGDVIRIGGIDGWVRRIRWRHTEIETFDADTLVVPNSTLLGDTLQILGRVGGRPAARRVWVYFNVDLAHDPEHVVQVMEAALRGSPLEGVAPEPAPHALLIDLAHPERLGYARYVARYHLLDPSRQPLVDGVVRARVLAAFHRAGIRPAAHDTLVQLVQRDERWAEQGRLAQRARRVEALAALDLFAAFARADLEQLADRLEERPFATGELMTREGDAADGLYLLAGGAAEVTLAAPGQPPQRVGRLVAPDYFGEMALISGAARAATVVAATPCLCLRLRPDDFRAFAQRHPEVLATFSAVLARREAELEAARGNLTGEQRTEALRQGRERLLREVERFFGLDAAPRSRA